MSLGNMRFWASAVVIVLCHLVVDADDVNAYLLLPVAGIHLDLMRLGHSHLYLEASLVNDLD
jgi:hypothetical protein